MTLGEAHRFAFAHFEAGRFPEAAGAYASILRTHPKDARAWHFLGLTEAKQCHFEKALQFQEKSLALAPSVAEYHQNAGSTYRVLGRFEDAERAYRRALKLRPDYAEAYFNLSSTRKFKEQDRSDLETIYSLIKRIAISDENRGFLGFAAGKILDDLGEYDEAFAHYKEANKSRSQSFDRSSYSDKLRSIREVFSAELIGERSAQGLADRRPVFIVGMPRSGTTLVEQILAAHPLVTGAGELPDVSSIMGTLKSHSPSGKEFPQCVPSLPEAVFPGFGKAYLNNRAKDIPPEGRLVDKMPSNYLHLGAIALMFPDASVIHCQRNALDTCLSCFFQRFREGHEYSADLEDLGFVYRCKEEMMSHWRQVLPRPFELDFEELISDQEGVTKRLVEYCGLPWDESCLRFHEVDRPVTTASNWQVRRPLNRGGIGRWKNYQRHLAPLKDSLAGN